MEKINPSIKVGKFYKWKGSNIVGQCSYIGEYSYQTCSIRLNFGGWPSKLGEYMWSKDGYDLEEATEEELQRYRKYLNSMGIFEDGQPTKKLHRNYKETTQEQESTTLFDF